MIKYDILYEIYKKIDNIFLKITKEIENYFNLKMEINIIKYVKNI